MKRPSRSPFRARIDAIVDARHLLTHPFYRAWTAGQLDRRALKLYAEQYFHHVLAEPTYLSRIHANTPAFDGDVGVRQQILDNLIDEEHGPGNHPALWKRFAAAVGADAATLHHTPALATTRTLIDTYRTLSAHPSFVVGLAAMYAFESQVPAIATAKIDGLQRHYGLDDPLDWRFFTVHRDADVVHADTEWALIEAHSTDDAMRDDVAHAVDRATHALWTFLDGVWQGATPVAHRATPTVS